MAEVFISAAEARGRLEAGWVPVDGTWFLPGTDRTGEAAFAEARLPGARRFDIDEVCDPTSGLPHMAPGLERFRRWMTETGVGASDRFVVYDANRFAASARVWWTLRRFGLEAVILDGGLAAWRAAGGEIESGPAEPALGLGDGALPERIQDDAVTWADVLHHVETGDALIVDARSTERFTGESAEPRPGLASGHIPGSISLPFTERIGEDGRMIAPDQIAQRLGAPRSATLICTCGSGVTAAILHAGFTAAGYADVRLYDGSWVEWAGRGDLPIETGPATR